MTDLVNHLTTCRLCKTGKLEVMFRLVPTPPANAFISSDLLNEGQTCFPLDFCRCDTCGHLQLSDVIKPEVLFRHYVYVSGTSPVMVEHLRLGADSAITQASLKSGDFVLEFGSNDGTFLRFFQQQGMKVLGIDPALNIAELASQSGIPTLGEFFGSELAQRIKKEHGAPKLILANNVCAHIDGIGDVFDAVKALLADDGIFIFEVGYLLDVVQNTYFDTIYHEHLDYHHVDPLVSFCESHGLELINVERVNIQGGAIRCSVQHTGGPHPKNSSVDYCIEQEHVSGLHLPQTFKAFGEHIEQRKVELCALLRGLKAQGKTIAAFGAPAKSTTLMYRFELANDVIDYIIDENPLKQGLFTPGLHVPVVSQNAIGERQPDYLVILAWNFAENIMARYSSYPASGGRFIVPLPDLAIYGDIQCD